MQPGDAASWATAAFTLALALVAWIQLNGQRTELKNVGKQLDDLKAEQIQQELTERRAKWEQERRAQALQVKLKRGDKVELLEPPVMIPTGYSYLAVTNQSDQPIRTVSVKFGPKWAYDSGKLDPDASGPQELQDSQRETVSEIVPGDTWYFLVYTTYRNEVPDQQVYATFTDANGVRWAKNPNEELEELAFSSAT
jgi:hypothetical protein